MRIKARNQVTLFHLICGSPFGSFGIVWSVVEDKPKVIRVLLSRPGLPSGQQLYAAFPDSIEATCPEIDGIAGDIKASLSGEEIQFSLEVVDMEQCTIFQQKVLRAEYGIPRGRVSSYQRIAGYLGNSNGARSVGNALANNPFPIIVPCHRAVRSDRSLGGYQGGLEMKRALLEMEGVDFDSTGRVATNTFFY